jgi:hypothetical protein
MMMMMIIIIIIVMSCVTNAQNTRVPFTQVIVASVWVALSLEAADTVTAPGAAPAVHLQHNLNSSLMMMMMSSLMLWLDW